MHRIATHIALLLVLTAVAQAGPQDELTPPRDAPGAGVSRSDRAKSKQHFAKAQKLYKQKKYDAALAELHQADDLNPEPDFLFGIAQVHVKLNHCADAITYYERFLDSHPGPAATRVTKQAIDACRAKLPPPPPPPPPPKPEPEPEPVVKAPGPERHDPSARHWYSDKVGDALLGAGTASGIVALLAYRAALGDLDVADRSTTLADHALHVEHAKTLRTYSLVFGSAAVVLVSAGVWHVRREDKTERAVAVVPVAGGAVVTVSGSWR